jgi:hypothetical protein
MAGGSAFAPPAPFVADFDGVIALLEQALANRQ